MMDHSKVTCELTSALQPWLNEALLYLRQQPDLMAELRNQRSPNCFAKRLSQAGWAFPCLRNADAYSR